LHIGEEDEGEQFSAFQPRVGAKNQATGPMSRILGIQYVCDRDKDEHFYILLTLHGSWSNLPLPVQRWNKHLNR